MKAILFDYYYRFSAISEVLKVKGTDTSYVLIKDENNKVKALQLIEDNGKIVNFGEVLLISGDKVMSCSLEEYKKNNPNGRLPLYSTYYKVKFEEEDITWEIDEGNEDNDLDFSIGNYYYSKEVASYVLSKIQDILKNTIK